MVDAWLTVRSPIEALALPEESAFTLTEAAPIERFLFRGDAVARLACSEAFGIELPPNSALPRRGATGRHCGSVRMSGFLWRATSIRKSFPPASLRG